MSDFMHIFFLQVIPITHLFSRISFVPLIRVTILREITEPLISANDVFAPQYMPIAEKSLSPIHHACASDACPISDRVLLVKSALCWPEETDCPCDRLRFISCMRDCLKLRRSVRSVYDLQEPFKNFRVAR